MTTAKTKIAIPMGGGGGGCGGEGGDVCVCVGGGWVYRYIVEFPFQNKSASLVVSVDAKATLNHA